MLPVNSATICSSYHAKVPIEGGLKSLSPCLKIFKSHNGHHHYRASSRKGCVSMCIRENVLFESINLRQSIPDVYQIAAIDDSYYVEKNETISVDNSLSYSTEIPPDSALTASASFSDGVQIDPSPVPDSVTISPDDIVSGAKDYLNSTLESISLSVKTSLAEVNKAFDDAVSEIISFVNKSGESAGMKLTGLTTAYKEKSGSARLAAVDALRDFLVVVEGLLAQGAKSVVYSYGYAKTFLPTELQDAISSTEDSIEKVLNPIGTALQQVYIAVEGLEGSLGLDPNDPLIQFVLFFGLSATLWGVYRVSKYGGYSGDLSPQSTFELLKGNENVVLVDIRPENLRERDGIPDLRRKARFRYASVPLPEVDGSVRKLLNDNREVEYSLLAAVIRNLKIADDRSMVLVMDSDGSVSKGVARSLRKLGTKRPYLVQGGFQSWAKDGFRIKMLKTETALTVISEEAEAILEEINPTPLKLIGYGLATAVAAYSVIEWEKTLQFVGVVGVGLTIYRRVSTYQNAEDFTQDVRLLVAPVKLGVEVVSRVTGKSEPSRNGLPTSPPSSSDVQNRVLQAAAKHESQPEETQDSSSLSSNENVNISEA